ncbi:MAG TPA: response regulator [Ferruginibacter sp.]|nr:response regulator [Ferruginibacter sp.]HMP22151.1 response regulator [Ferruginibacter sp.]
MQPVNILLVEDSEGDILLTTEALEGSSLINSLNVVKNGKDALDYLHKKGNYTSVTIPDLILLDINLPMKNGHEVLAGVKQSEQLKHIPVIILTTSSSEKDIHQSYKHYANCYITKPVEAGDYTHVINSIERFWFSLVKLPGRH